MTNISRPSALSDLINKNTLTELELVKLQRMAAYLYDENASQSDIIRNQNLQQFRRFHDDECWIWQGDGIDNIDTITCPVVIHPRELSRLLSSNRMVHDTIQRMGNDDVINITHHNSSLNISNNFGISRKNDLLELSIDFKHVNTFKDTEIDALIFTITDITNE